jgi:hypothetical protein
VLQVCLHSLVVRSKNIEGVVNSQDKQLSLLGPKHDLQD